MALADGSSAWGSRPEVMALHLRASEPMVWRWRIEVVLGVKLVPPEVVVVLALGLLEEGLGFRV